MIAGAARRLRQCTLAKRAARFFSLADRARDRTDRRGAIALYRRGLALAPLAWTYRVQLAHALKDFGQLKEAEVQYLGALEAAPSDADIHLQLGHLNRLLGYEAQAGIFYARAHHLGSLDVHALHFLNETYRDYPDLGWRYPPSACDNPELREILAPLLTTNEESSAGASSDRLRLVTGPTGTLGQSIVRQVMP